jgi:hypothetical protein
MALAKGKRKLTASPKAEPEVTLESEVTEAENAVAPEMALVRVKGTLTDFANAERVVTRIPEVLEDGTATGGTLKSIEYRVGSEVFEESAFYRKYTPVGHQAAVALRQEG